jgi:hypothetical protein
MLVAVVAVVMAVIVMCMPMGGIVPMVVIVPMGVTVIVGMRVIVRMIMRMIRRMSVMVRVVVAVRVGMAVIMRVIMPVVMAMSVVMRRIGARVIVAAIAVMRVRLGRALTDLPPQDGGANHGQHQEHDPAPQDEVVKLRPEHHLQHVDVQEVERQADAAERRRQGDQAKLIQIIRIAVFVNMGHGRTPCSPLAPREESYLVRVVDFVASGATTFGSRVSPIV